MDQEPNQYIINQCPECSKDIDVTALAPYSKVVCPHCETSVRVRNLLGQYMIKGLLGEGGMSQVFAAEDVTLGRVVALKILHQELSRDSKLTAMFEREAKLTASINHPNVVKVYTVGHENGYFYIAMELVDATSVEEIIANKGAQPEADVLNIAYDVVAGLKAAYQENLIHRDIKPGNMLVTDDGTAKLVDFGLAVAQGGADENEDIWATPFYVPPEKLVREPDTYLGDIYALGATCYHALAGQPPFLANTSSLDELIAIKSAGVDLKSVAPNASPGTIKLIEQMMAHSPSGRPSSYDQLLAKIDARRQELGAISQTNVHTVKSNKNGLALKGGIAIGAAALVIGGFLFIKSKSNSNDPDIISITGEGGGSRVISKAEREAAQKMQEGRSAMVRGRLSVASRIFSELEGNKNFTQPSSSWNIFSQGLIEVLNGHEKKSRVAFEQLVTQKGFDSKTQKQYRTFFRNIGKTLSDPLPVLRSDVVVDSTSFESIALLAAGAKNWQQGQYEEADKFFADFLKVETPASDQWIGEMKPLVANYQSDLKIFNTLPNPSQNMTETALNNTLNKLEKAAKNLKSKGSMNNVVKSRIERTKNFLKATKKKETPQPPPTSLPAEWTEAELEEVQTLQSLVSSFPDYRSTYLFSGAVLKLEAVSLSSPKGKALQQDLIEGYKAADQFIGNLSSRLNQGNYAGVIRRKQGSDLEAKVVAASSDSFTIDLGFGENEVDIDLFHPSWLAEAGVKSIGTPTSSNIKDLKEAFWFATACGLNSEANRIAVAIIALDPNFLEQGKRFRKISFTPSE